MSDRITLRDCRLAGHCIDGVRVWCESRGVIWEQFLKDGMDREEALSSNDPIVIKIVKIKDARNGS